MGKTKTGTARFQVLTESTHAGVLGTDDDGRVRYCSVRAASLFGCASSDLLGVKIARLIVADGLDEGDFDGARSLDAVGQRADGTAFPLDLTVVSISAETSDSIVWIVRERSDGDVGLEDPLTLLPNRRSCMQRVRERLEHASLNQGEFALFVAALDGLEDLSRAADRPAVDGALVEAASRLRHALPGADLVGKLGGNEFCVVASRYTGVHELEALARATAESLEFSINAHERPHQVTPRIGVAVAPGDGDNADALFESAAAALGRARHEATTTCYYSARIADQLRKRRSLREAIRAALEANRFSLDFLPFIDLATGAVTGAEALLRWKDPGRGTVAPLDFIPLAEESGLMIPIGTWVMREALRCVHRWNAAGRALRVAVNVTARQLNAPGFFRQLTAALASSGCDPNSLELEITESVAMANAATVQMILSDVRAAGVRTALDDFGTGYSSMAYLKSIPVDVIKIDRSFVDGVPHDNSDSSIVRAIVAFALCTGREVRAEGVTSLEQARWLHAEGCDAAQGFFFSKPIPAEQFDAWLTAYEAESQERPI